MMLLIISYDISDNKLRTRFSKFLEKYGARLQYSVFEIKSSKRILQLIIAKIEGQFSQQFQNTDSVFIFKVNDKETIKYGNAIHRDMDFLFIE